MNPYFSEHNYSSIVAVAATETENESVVGTRPNVEGEIRGNDGERVEEVSETNGRLEMEVDDVTRYHMQGKITIPEEPNKSNWKIDVIPAELIPPNAVDVTHNKCGKLWKEDIVKGKEKVIVKCFMIAKIHYKAWLATDPSKTIIDSSSFYEDDTEPMEVTIGEREVIRAIDNGIIAMTRKGQKSLFIAHFDYAYGRHSQHFPETSNIPNKSFICLEIELVDVFFSLDPNRNNDPDHITEDIKLEVTKVSKDSHQVTTNSIVFAEVEGQYNGKVFLQKIILPLYPRSLTWGMKQESEAEKMLPEGLAYAVRSLALNDGLEGRAIIKGESAYKDDFEGKVVIDGSYQKWMVPKGAEVKFFISIDEVEELFDPFVLSLREKLEFCVKELKKAKSLIEKKSYEAAGLKLNILIEHIFITDPRLCLKNIPDELDEGINQASYVLCALYGKLYGKLDEKLFSVKDAVKNWGRAIDLMKTQKREDVSKQLIAIAHLERALLQWNIKEYELALEDLKCAMIHHMTYSLIKKDEDEYERSAFLKILDVGDLESGERAVNRIKYLIKETEAKIKGQKKKGFVLKYYPPK